MKTLPLLVLASAIGRVQAADLNLIPWPVNVEPGSGALALTRETAVVVESAFTNEAALLQQDLLSTVGLSLQQRQGAAKAGGVIRMLKTPPFAGGPEAYSLDITAQQVTLRAAEPEGMFRATQTLLQLLPADVTAAGKPCELHCVHIEDAPRFSWRGLMLDCSRTFQSPEYVRATLDRMALYKLNVLHLHLTDEQGWRFEVKKYPELTRKGARFAPEYNEPGPHQGFYTQSQLKELVRYAQQRGIVIVPEIEMPSHCIAALVCRPDLACPGPFLDKIVPYGPMLAEAKKDWSRYPIFCAGNEDTFQFLEDVLDEVLGVFPSQYIHIGGDEAPKARWKTCPKCQARIKAEGLKDEHELQSYFVRRISTYLAGKGRRLIGWDEILEGGLAPNAAVMSWRGMSGGMAAARAGHEVVMSPTSHCYFDYGYSAINSARAFSFDPLAGLAPEAAPRVLGLQANFWSHLAREPELVDAQLFPRLLALAERAWSPAGARDWPDYLRRAQGNLPRLQRLGIHYFPLDLTSQAGRTNAPARTAAADRNGQR